MTGTGPKRPNHPKRIQSPPLLIKFFCRLLPLLYTDIYICIHFIPYYSYDITPVSMTSVVVGRKSPLPYTGPFSPKSDLKLSGIHCPNRSPLYRFPKLVPTKNFFHYKTLRISPSLCISISAVSLFNLHLIDSVIHCSGPNLSVLTLRFPSLLTLVNVSFLVTLTYRLLDTFPLSFFFVNFIFLAPRPT